MIVTTCSVADLHRHDGHRWAIVRHAMWRNKDWLRAGIRWVPDLAPPAGLLRWWRQEPATMERWHEYRERFRRARGDAYWRELRATTLLSGHGSLVLACWCQDPRCCHRSLVVQDLLQVWQAEAGPDAMQLIREEDDGNA